MQLGYGRETGVAYEDDKARCPAHRYELMQPLRCGNCNTLEYARLKSNWEQGNAIVALKEQMLLRLQEG